jgi:hypothetical protein
LPLLFHHHWVLLQFDWDKDLTSNPA